eukprot:TRINITY_DN27545_c0_g1_i1.p3 TRINITY_DN27545_c0_g1~~TRINITY_DN27545_c0_g1_i1.p3  ORF type:complete len:150 (-),score=2.99 TRINITY_DN27545_c0_g1_i1:122-571(-)
MLAWPFGKDEGQRPTIRRELHETIRGIIQLSGVRGSANKSSCRVHLFYFYNGKDPLKIFGVDLAADFKDAQKKADIIAPQNEKDIPLGIKSRIKTILTCKKRMKKAPEDNNAWVASLHVLYFNWKNSTLADSLLKGCTFQKLCYKPGTR